MNNQDVQFDVAVIGGGPAGMMAAVCAAQNGARVALIEKNENPGRKLLMTGNGRCNLTQAEFNINELVAKYTNGKFLYSAFTTFGPQQTIEFFEKNKLKTKVEKEGKVFPQSDQSKDVLNVLIQLLKENCVNFFFDGEVKDIICSEETKAPIGDLVSKKIEKVILKKREITAKKYIIAVGGKSYPHSGSSGDGYNWAKKIGHTIIKPKPVLVPVKTKENWAEKLQGVSVHGCKSTVLVGDKKIAESHGDMIFTHFGLSGPMILNLSRDIEKVLGSGEIKISLDLKPYLSFEQLDEILKKDFEKNASKNFSNCLADLFSPKLREFLLEKSGIEPTKHCAKISKQERKQLLNLIKNLEMTVDSLFGFEKAMVTSGGISTKEIDSKTMKSKIIDNLFFAGEIIDVDGPTGGYNLQICWSSGFVAGTNASKQ